MEKKNKISSEQLLTALQKKKECNARALRIVESLLQPKITREYFLETLFHINQCHYEDVVDERHILQLCGYPLCTECVLNVPVQKYKISTVNKKVYDITNRKKFCSTYCFKASEYIQSQLLTSPLWLRSKDDLIEFKLLEPTIP